MNIKHVFEDSRIVMLEKDIARINEYCQYSDEEKFVMKHLLKKRCNVLWQLNVYDDETKQLLIGFNDALRKACTQLYHRTMTVYQEYLHRKDISGDFEVEGKIFLGYEYPAHHPIQTETAKQVWDTLTCGGFNTLYDEGCAWPLRFSRERSSEQSINEKLENWLGMEIENDNWNEGLDREWSKDMHLIQPFHNLYDHCYFSLYDLIYVREFNLEVHVEFDDINIKPNKPLELYNLLEDPEEKHNLAKKYPEMVIGFDKVMTNNFKIMGSIFLFMFFAWRLKGFGKAITTPTRKSLVPAGIDSAMSRRHGFMPMTTEDKVSTKY